MLDVIAGATAPNRYQNTAWLWMHVNLPVLYKGINLEHVDVENMGLKPRQKMLSISILCADSCLVLLLAQARVMPSINSQIMQSQLDAFMPDDRELFLLQTWDSLLSVTTLCSKFPPCSVAHIGLHLLTSRDQTHWFRQSRKDRGSLGSRT